MATSGCGKRSYDHKPYRRRRAAKSSIRSASVVPASSRQDCRCPSIEKGSELTLGSFRRPVFEPGSKRTFRFLSFPLYHRLHIVAPDGPVLDLASFLQATFPFICLPFNYLATARSLELNVWFTKLIKVTHGFGGSTVCAFALINSTIANPRIGMR